MRGFNEPLRRAGSDRISRSREIDLITFARAGRRRRRGAERGASAAPSITSASMSSCGAESRINKAGVCAREKGASRNILSAAFYPKNSTNENESDSNQKMQKGDTFTHQFFVSFPERKQQIIYSAVWNRSRNPRGLSPPVLFWELGSVLMLAELQPLFLEKIWRWVRVMEQIDYLRCRARRFRDARKSSTPPIIHFLCHFLIVKNSASFALNVKHLHKCPFKRERVKT